MRICIVNDATISFNPRTVKGASALSEAGHSVRVVSVSKTEGIDKENERLLVGQSWRYEAANYRRGNVRGEMRWLLSGIGAKAYKRLARVTPEPGFAERALGRYRKGLLKLALREPADMYVALGIVNLPVAAAAASARNSLLGFDIEDYYPDEDTPGMSDPTLGRLKGHLMEKYLRRCAHLSATSEKMADVVSERFGVLRPLVLYNVFPLSYAAGILPPASRNGAARTESYTAYWFSHVIGLDRGLQDFIRVMPLLNRRVDLHLRGRVGDGVRDELLRLAGSLGVERQIFFLSPISPVELVSDAARFDFGLALEQPININKKVTVSNKLFTYLLAGIVPVATDTPGQREIIERIGGCDTLYEPGAIVQLASILNRLLANPAEMLAAKERAWHAARSSYCWDIEKQKLLSAVDRLGRERDGLPPTRTDTASGRAQAHGGGRPCTQEGKKCAGK